MNIRTIGIGIVAVALILVISMTASAEPVASDSNGATGGAITSVDHTGATTQTYNWAGYYGDVGGTLRLGTDTAKMYEWTTADTGGEVYASTASSITWSNIRAESAADVDTNLSYLLGKSDSATITFDGTNSAMINVGTVPISSGGASATHMYVDGVAQTNDFEEVILTDGTNTVWTAIISPNKDGFESDSTTHDYQMIVPEDGSGNSDATTYYFYVELS
ncbi:MAG: hypothetical protein ACNYWM_03870 [Methanosarcinales archaeon]